MFKQNNIFVCKHDTHKHFSSKISVYHILEEKKCFPDGCVYFKWKCKVLAKKKKCHRNFSTVGKHCFSCKYFYEEKIHQFPELVVEGKNKQDFFNDYNEYCDWISSIENKQVFCEGTVQSVVPDFLINKKNGKPGLGLKGFLIIFQEGFIDNQHFEDTFYLHVDTMYQNKLRLRENDEIEFKAIVKEIDGKIELFSPRCFNFYLRGNSKPLLRSDLIVSLKTATTFNVQHEKCKKCGFSVIPKIQNNTSGKNRILICCKGIQEPENCIENINRSNLYSDSCDNDKSNNVSCSRTL